MLLESTQKQGMSGLGLGLNPYCVGRCSWRCIHGGGLHPAGAVLILIVLEDALGGCDQGKISNLLKMVLILIVLEDALGEIIEL